MKLRKTKWTARGPRARLRLGLPYRNNGKTSAARCKRAVNLVLARCFFWANSLFPPFLTYGIQGP
jgi:hypothetical protein